MRGLVLIFLAACTTSHPVVDRTACETCHATAYDTTDHVARGYPTTCSNCHGTTAWLPAEADHKGFNLTSSSHAGWDCADCHLSITYDPPAIPTPKSITCTSCHWHTAGRTDPKHLGNGDYTYAPASCLRCHAGGRR